MSNTFRISCLNAATGAVARSSERIVPVNAGLRPTATLPTFGPLQKEALFKSILQDRFGWTGNPPIQPMFYARTRGFHPPYVRWVKPTALRQLDFRASCFQLRFDVFGFGFVDAFFDFAASFDQIFGFFSDQPCLALSVNDMCVPTCCFNQHADMTNCLRPPCPRSWTRWMQCCLQVRQWPRRCSMQVRPACPRW